MTLMKVHSSIQSFFQYFYKVKSKPKIHILLFTLKTVSGEHNYFERVLIGIGNYISPEDMKNYPYLTKQNTLSEKVSRLQAESLKFIAGFSDPLPWNMKSAVTFILKTRCKKRKCCYVRQQRCY